jgi:hypothetical protein
MSSVCGGMPALAQSGMVWHVPYLCTLCIYLCTSNTSYSYLYVSTYILSLEEYHTEMLYVHVEAPPASKLTGGPARTFQHTNNKYLLILTN